MTEYIKCHFCNMSILNHFPTYRDHINNHDKEIKQWLLDDNSYLFKCSACGELVDNEDFHEFSKTCSNCLNISLRERGL